MSMLTGETIVCGQRVGGDIQLNIYGDEFYARYENLDGYTVVFDKNIGCYCYALLAAGRFISSGIAVNKPTPDGLHKHLKEDPALRNKKFAQNYTRLRPVELETDSSASFTLGSDDGLLSGRKLHQGTVRGLTIIVDFEDVTTSISQQAVDDMFNASNYTANGNFCSINEYFKIISSGKLNYINTVIGPIKLSKRRSHYISNLLVKEALDIAIETFDLDLADFDSRGEKIIDAINFLYAGDSQYNGQLWPHNSVARLSYGEYSTNYYQLTGLGSHPVDLRIGTICHENGHLLCRFPDMYDYGKRDGDAEKSQGIGRYCLMGSGNHLNERRTPSPVCAYLRELAGWVDNVILLESSATISAEHGNYNTAWKHKTSLPNEYFMIENRSNLGLDSHLPSNGLAVYHCDTLGSNEWQDGTRNKHYQCALLQADGSLDLENNRNAGDAGDLFRLMSGVFLSDTTTPSSRMWNGSDSGLVIADVGEAGQTINFTFGESQEQPIVKIETFPNLVIPDNDPVGVQSSIEVSEFGQITDVSIVVDIIHSWISDLKVLLIAPDGKEVILHDREGNDGDDIRVEYNKNNLAALSTFDEGEVHGSWSLKVIDSESADVGRLVSWKFIAKYSGSSNIVTEGSQVKIDIPDKNIDGISSVVQFHQEGVIRNISVEVDIQHTYIGDLRVELISPAGRSVRLHNRSGASSNNIKRLFTAESTPELDEFIGDQISGNWRLNIKDLVAQDIGRLNSWSMTCEY